MSSPALRARLACCCTTEARRLNRRIGDLYNVISAEQRFNDAWGADAFCPCKLQRSNLVLYAFGSLRTGANERMGMAWHGTLQSTAENGTVAGTIRHRLQ
ncbi:uncharacterized protein BP5553_00570 [Venustampulla echinocandica]|uniref:Uncharacterized protein n=1 Tax=Venustampulla echinocandica TaxID=2656787 RepID=A0A370TYJ2_9HELO|nr:uncharacterized protein BP5553_00570 [Venustampulla echinocandica]RDL40591.1 hypothetical protein BP5553_00570 [Venustampulla echinocandica]